MISNDVNVIFAYIDRNHKHYRRSRSFVNNNIRRKYVMLAMVKQSFIKTYQDYVDSVAIIILESVIKEKEERKNSIIKKPTQNLILKSINYQINKELKALNKQYPNLTYDSLESIKNILLSTFSILQLYNKKDSMGDFRETFIAESNKYSIRALNRFLTNFKKGDVMQIMQYNNYENMKKIGRAHV